MRRALILAAVLAGVLLVVLALSQNAAIAQTAAGWQRDFQNGIARVLRGLRAGEGGAWAGLIGMCFGYGFVHAVGPGHGKFLVGAYGAGRPVAFTRLAGATVAASLGQAVTAVLLVLAGIGLFDLSRQQMTRLAEGTLTRLSLISIIALGLWVLTRGLRRLRTIRAAAPAQVDHDHDGHAHAHHDHNHDHDHSHGAACGCGHAHAPSPAEVASATTTTTTTTTATPTLITITITVITTARPAAAATLTPRPRPR